MSNRSSSSATIVDRTSGLHSGLTKSNGWSTSLNRFDVGMMRSTSTESIQ